MMAALAARPGPWLAEASARPLVHWREAQLRQLADALAQPVSAWCADWGMPPGGTPRCETVLRLEGGLAWRPLVRGTEAAGWLHLPAGLADCLAAILVGDAAAGPIARSLGKRCEEDALARVLAALHLTVAGGSAQGPTAREAGAWSGVVELRLPDPLAMRLVLVASAVDTWLATHARAKPVGSPPAMLQPLRPVLEALAEQPIALNVQLAGCELDIGSMQGLRPGDVLRLRHRIETPAVVRDATGADLFGAYLGRRAGARAAELTGAAALPISSDEVQA